MYKSNKNGFTPDDLKTAEHWHLFWVFRDPEFVKAVNSLDQPPDDLNIKNWRHPYTNLAKDYEINYGDVYRFKKYGMDAMLLGASLVGYGYGFVGKDRKLDVIQVLVKKNITKDEFIRLWPWVKEVQASEFNLKATKRKPPEDTKLLYAIFKAKKSKLSFTDIFREYQDGALRYYINMPTNQFSSVDSLKRYYYKHRLNKDGDA